MTEPAYRPAWREIAMSTDINDIKQALGGWNRIWM